MAYHVFHFHMNTVSFTTEYWMQLHFVCGLYWLCLYWIRVYHIRIRPIRCHRIPNPIRLTWWLLNKMMIYWHLQWHRRSSREQNSSRQRSSMCRRNRQRCNKHWPVHWRSRSSSNRHRCSRHHSRQRRSRHRCRISSSHSISWFCTSSSSSSRNRH